MTAANSSIVEDVLNSRFIDLEDGLQYECAASIKAHVIISKNVHDFFASTIPVVHPSQFVNSYRNLLK